MSSFRLDVPILLLCFFFYSLGQWRQALRALTRVRSWRTREPWRSGARSEMTGDKNSIPPIIFFLSFSVVCKCVVGLDLNWLLMRWLDWWHQRDDSFAYSKTCEIDWSPFNAKTKGRYLLSSLLSHKKITLVQHHICTRKVHWTILAVVPDFAEPGCVSSLVLLVRHFTCLMLFSSVFYSSSFLFFVFAVVPSSVFSWIFEFFFLWVARTKEKNVAIVSRKRRASR